MDIYFLCQQTNTHTTMTIKEFYTTNYPDDKLGLEINKTNSLAGLWNELLAGGDLYEYIGVKNSVIRERLFKKLADDIGESYDYVYNLWITS
jgi:hypothetical protein